MPLKIRDNLDRRVALAGVNHVETQSPGNGWWILKSRIKIHDCSLASGNCKPVPFKFAETLSLQTNLALNLIEEGLRLAHQRFALLLSGENNDHSVRAGPVDKGGLPKHSSDI